ncbi:O-methyltransferase-domain-containing protein [Penicillium cataractarum]|uniref:O-methyltransferase-domain-containing protein n=1 Tax=Penicillium cataractarum TaxID=2100454 RepID=A0A9W9SFD1_9EURO|nr:O-methyltransferase-domain-containing protein [Penicillium cataractarum]KAJ5377602.1 O-methyltransferase-domain-containing protein [Penicillium cataractarum]
MAQIRALAQKLAASANDLSNELESQGLAEYSFSDPNAPLDLPLLSAPGSIAQAELISAAEELLRLAHGPLTYLNRYQDVAFEIGTIRALIRLGIPSMIPLHERATYPELSRKSGTHEPLLRRMIRFAVVCGFLTERDGRVGHSAESAIFVKDSRSADGATWTLEVGFRSSGRLYEALQLDPTGEDGKKTAVSVEYHEGHHYPTIWEVHAARPLLSRGFDNLMATQIAQPIFSLQHVLRSFDWKQITSLVDVGGGKGHAARAIFDANAHIKCTVQDTNNVLGEKQTAGDVSFMTHDFFQPQLLQADMFLFRLIIHDWSDEDAQRIIAATIPGLRKGARLAIMDTIVPEPGTDSIFSEKAIRALDLAMYGMFAGKERSLQETQKLVASVDGRLVFERCYRPEGSLMSFMTWVFHA